MAADEALLEQVAVTGPVLRFYGWTRAAVSFGRHQPYPVELIGEREAVRRPTGGGVVFHEAELTYALVLPPEHPVVKLSRRESYRVLHAALATVLPESRLGAAPEQPPERRTLQCFRSPVEFDLVTREGVKLAGGAQRRTRQGLLHQGSVRLIGAERRAELQRRLESALDRVLGGDGYGFEPSAALLARTEELVRLRYGTREWNGGSGSGKA